MVSADGAQHYINQGGAELVTFTASGYWTEAGVRVGKYTFRSFPMPGKNDPNASERFSLFAFPWDVPADTVPVVYVKNPSGAEATARFWFKVFPKKFRARDLQLDDTFLQKVVSELDPNGSGDLADRFLKINREMRAETINISPTCATRPSRDSVVGTILSNRQGRVVLCRSEDLSL